MVTCLLLGLPVQSVWPPSLAAALPDARASEADAAKTAVSRLSTDTTTRRLDLPPAFSGPRLEILSGRAWRSAECWYANDHLRCSFWFKPAPTGPELTGVALRQDGRLPRRKGKLIHPLKSQESGGVGHRVVITRVGNMSRVWNRPEGPPNLAGSGHGARSAVSSTVV